MKAKNAKWVETNHKSFSVDSKRVYTAGYVPMHSHSDDWFWFIQKTHGLDKQILFWLCERYSNKYIEILTNMALVNHKKSNIARNLCNKYLINYLDN